MISTDLQRVQIQDIIEYQLPAFVRDDFPLVGEFLKQYYISQEYPTAPSDIIQNIDEYVKLETLLDTQDETNLGADISFSDTTSTVGFDLGDKDRHVQHGRSHVHFCLPRRGGPYCRARS